MSKKLFKPLLAVALSVALAISVAPAVSAAPDPGGDRSPSASESDTAKPAGKPNTAHQRAAAATAEAAAEAAVAGSVEIDDPGCTATSLAANDDGSTGLVQLPFAVNYYGTQYPGLFVNNNGNVTFQSALSSYTPFTIGANTPPIIAAFLADVDTRGIGSSVVTYGDAAFEGRPAFCVNWNGVGYYGSHADKLNSFQLLLVDRSDIGTGDFDIVMNYGQLLWETGDASGGSNGFGGSSAGAGFSAGDGSPDHYFQFPGTLTNGAFLDDNPEGLVHGSRGSLEAGRYVFPVRNGLAPGSATLTGTVTTVAGDPAPAAAVQACPATGSGSCLVSYSSSSGIYSLVGVPDGDWNLTAFPPAGSNGLAAHAGPVTVAVGAVITTNLQLGGPTPPPAGAGITDHGTSGGLPVVYWGEELTLTSPGCQGVATASASYQMTQGATVVRSGAMAETPAGSNSYRATVAALYPVHGTAHVAVTLTCADGTTQTVEFDIYIDPSGTVVDTLGQPIEGATVSLLRSDSMEGTYAAVEDGSAIMSPSNRTNPDITGADGIFAWDVLAGYYEVTASKDGCTVPGSSETVARSERYPVPPPALNIVLTLDCGEDVGTSHTELTVSPGDPVVGQEVTFTATVGGAGPAPTGTVEFRRPLQPFEGCEAVALVGTTATCTLTFTYAQQLSVIANYSGDAQHPTSTDSENVTIGKATPVVTWAKPADITYPTPLSETQLNATANVPGTFSYSVGESPAMGQVLAPGVDWFVSVTFRPTDSANYWNANSSQLITVLKGSQTITADAVDDVILGSAASTSATFHGGASGNPVVVATTSTACSVAGIQAGASATYTATINVLGVGTCVLTATQAGNGDYEDAAPVSVTFDITPAVMPNLAVDTAVYKDQTAAASKIVAPKLTTAGGNELILATVSADGPATTGSQSANVTGGGLTWKLVTRANATWGTAEVWQAFASSKLTNATITASLRKAGYTGTLTVTAFSGAKNATGASAFANGTKKDAAVKIVPGATGSMIWAVGHDWSGAQSVTPASGQARVRQFVNSKVGDTYWTQKTTATSTAGSAVTMSAKLPMSHRWQLVAVEIQAG